MRRFADGDEAGRRTGWIVGRSRIARVGLFVVGRSVASARSSRTLTLARRGLREFQSLPSSERARCGLITLTAALAGHVVLAALLPPSARPSVALTTLAFLGAALVLAAAVPRSR